MGIFRIERHLCNLIDISKEGMALSCNRETQVGYLEKFIHREQCEALEQAAWGSDKVIIPRGVQEGGMCRTEGHGLVDNMVVGGRLD